MLKTIVARAVQLRLDVGIYEYDEAEELSTCSAAENIAEESSR